MAPELDDWKTKQLLQDFESSGKTRADINLLSLCNKKKDIYGPPGSELRRLVQRKFQTIKKKTIENYASTLDAFQVAQGLTTQRLVQRLRAGDQVEEDSASFEDFPVETIDEVEFEESDDNIELAFANLSFIPKETTTLPPQKVTFKQSPISTPSKQPPTLSNSAMSFGSPAGDALVCFSTPNAEPDNTNEHANDSGTRANPYQIHVNLERPEDNREFDVELIQQIEHGNHTLSGVHIRRLTAVQDFMIWEATVSRDPDFKDRAILIKGPSRDFWFNQIEEYHKDMDCAATKRAHLATAGEIASDEERHFKYWLLIFPESIILDNGVFSGHPTNIESNVVGLESNMDDLDFRSAMIYWQVALKNGGRRIKAKKATCVKSLFKSPPAAARASTRWTRSSMGGG